MKLKAKLLEASVMERNVADDLDRREEAARSATQEARKTEDDLASCARRRRRSGTATRPAEHVSAPIRKSR